ncbi:cation:proton antiporter, partial [Candidatus Woesearchaeota archaeon]|nr:cation:proton antiporter [Candidatus Woesearchaeota archaeon]
DIALLCLMFLAGLESSWRALYEERKDAIVITIFAALIPFIIGFAVFKLLGFSLLVSSIVGICMSITAEATNARVLLDLSKLKTRVGAAMMDAGIFDDILGLSLFILITFLLKAAYLKEDLLIAGAILAFFVGIIVQKTIGRNKNPILKFVEKYLLILLVPFFFISMGIHFEPSSIFTSPYLLIIIIAIAITGKLAGTFLTKPFTKFSWKQLHLIGWGMNSRGAIELALALIAFRSALIPAELYSSLVIMALTTTLIFPFIISRMIRKNPKLMN